MEKSLSDIFGSIDIYLFDQLLKGTFDNCKKVLDVGCGTGRNLHYFLKNDYQVFGVDKDPEAVRAVQELSTRLSASKSPKNFKVASAEALPFKDNFFDLAISSAVFHFAKDDYHFDEMVRSVWRVIKPGGYLFARLASNIGIEELVINLGNGRHLLPDGTERYIVTHDKLLHYTAALNGHLFEPIKTTNVHNLRCMTTWCLQKI